MGRLLPASLIAGVRHSFRPPSTTGSCLKTLSNGLHPRAVTPLHRRGVSVSSSQIQHSRASMLLESSQVALQPSLVAHFDRHAEAGLLAEEENVEQRVTEALMPCSLTETHESTCSEPCSSQHDQNIERKEWPNLRKLAPGEFLYKQVSAYHKQCAGSLHTSVHR